MKKLLSLTLIGICVLSAFAQEAEEKSLQPIQLSLAYPIGTAGVNSPNYANRISINMIYGVNGGVDGIVLGGFANVNKGSVNGVQLSGALNVNTESSHGVLGSGFANITLLDASGIQMAGYANYSGQTRGLMMSGFMNRSENMDGGQLAGTLNIAEDVDGIQASGLMNIAKSVKGMQIAPLINIADTSDYCIGLINIIKSGEKGVGVTVDETNTTMLSFRSGGRVMYGIVGAGYVLDDEFNHLALEAGLGAILFQPKKVRLRLELVNTTYEIGDRDTYFKSTLRIMPSFATSHFEFMAAPTLNFVYSDQDNTYEAVDNYLWKDNNDNSFNGLYIGFTAGINYRF
ncbi:MAG: hypothetical protein CMB80_27770 [Flammeovirgaceae bacterium]|nr:hypothetical protein [Flammeovirgaceae bacterium]HCX20870.1 hypothetical protein [Cytophagales bacterium]